jgi:hypothetical protein
MVSIKSDVGQFNRHVKSKVIALAARGETTQDLLPNVFKGYKSSADPVFVAYIAKKQDDYDEGIPPSLPMKSWITARTSGRQ